MALNKVVVPVITSIIISSLILIGSSEISFAQFGCTPGLPCTLFGSCETGICTPGCTGLVCPPGPNLPQCVGTGIPVSTGTVCRIAFSICDVAEVCTGLSTACPPDIVQPSSLLCRQSAGVCDIEEKCDGISKLCPPDEFAGTNISCEDGDRCTGPDNCNGAGGCTAGPSTTCTDGDACNGSETCNPATGICVGGLPLVCNDGNICNGDEICDAATGCVGGTPLVCNDGNFCNGDEICDAATGCVGGTPPDCSDGISCTDDSCNTGTDQCDNTPNDANCDDGQLCNGAEICDPDLDCKLGVLPPGVPECSSIGGNMIQVESKSILLAGAQTSASWMIPVLVSAIGFAIVIATKFSKYQPV